MSYISSEDVSNLLRNRTVLSKRDQVLAALRESGVLRPRDLTALGVSPAYLQKLLTEGVLERPTRGSYVLASTEPTEHRPLAEAAVRVPQGVVCLLSALQFHGLTTQAPFEVWMAIGPKARLPRMESPPLRVVRFSGTALTFGVQTHDVEGVAVPVYSPAKTVADCFKYRNKIGLDVALEALRETWKGRRASLDDLYQAAQACRMTNVLRPYLESLTT